MKTYNGYFILSSDCKVVRGAKRSVIIDYGRGDIYFISHAHHQLLEELDRNKIDEFVRDFIDEDSMALFDSFLSHLLRYEIGFITDDPGSFPTISDEDSINDYVALIDAIIEIDEKYFDIHTFAKVCTELSDLRCRDLQFRILSSCQVPLLEQIAEIIRHTDVLYVEIHAEYDPELDMDSLAGFIEGNSFVRKIYLYGAPDFKEIQVAKDIPDHKAIPLGNIYFLNYNFDGGNCCGIINHESLNFKNIYLHNQLKTKNGCLDRKISIDRYGNIKNCPSMKSSYGKVNDVSIKSIIAHEEFRRFWYINKDQISICRSCEFRYNCTDCRAFLVDPADIYSKPLKCGYNPLTCVWEDWSVNTLKDKGVAII